MGEIGRAMGVPAPDKQRVESELERLYDRIARLEQDLVHEMRQRDDATRRLRTAKKVSRSLGKALDRVVAEKERLRDALALNGIEVV